MIISVGFWKRLYDSLRKMLDTVRREWWRDNDMSVADMLDDLDSSISAAYDTMRADIERSRLAMISERERMMNNHRVEVAQIWQQITDDDVRRYVIPPRQSSRRRADPEYVIPPRQLNREMMSANIDWKTEGF